MLFLYKHCSAVENHLVAAADLFPNTAAKCTLKGAVSCLSRLSPLAHLDNGFQTSRANMLFPTSSWQRLKKEAGGPP